MAFVLWKKLCVVYIHKEEASYHRHLPSAHFIYYPIFIDVPIHILISHRTYHTHHTPSKTDLNVGVFSFNLLGRWSVNDPFYLFIKKKTFVQLMMRIWFAEYAMINCITAPKTRLFYGLLRTSHI